MKAILVRLAIFIACGVFGYTCSELLKRNTTLHDDRASAHTGEVE